MEDISYLIEGASFSRRSTEDELVLQYAQERDLPVEYASLRQVTGGRFRVKPGQVPVGGIPFVRAAARQLGIAGLEQSCYPAALQPYLRRALETDTLRAVVARLENGGAAAFIKPAERTKRFTGFVLDNAQDYRLAGVSKALPVWVSTPVKWVSEWRAYVVEHKVRHLSLYAGTREALPNHEAVNDMVQLYAASGGPAGYALDVGVLAGPEGLVTALVEVNEGFAVGAYEQTPADVYAEMLTAFWRWVGQEGCGRNYNR